MKTLQKISLALAIALCSANSFGFHYLGLSVTSSFPEISKTNPQVFYPHIFVGFVPHERINLEVGFNHTHYDKDDLNLKFRTVHLTALANHPLDGDNFKILYGVGFTKVVKHQVRYYGACMRDVKDSYDHKYKITDATGCSREENYKMESNMKRYFPLKLEREKLFPHFLIGFEKLIIPNLYFRTLYSWHNYRAISPNEPFLNNLHQFTVGLKYTYK